MKPQRKPATQSRPPKAPLGQAAGGMGARSVGSPAGGRRTAAVFSSFGAAATNPILARNRQIVNGEVRRLGFAPIPSRRSNSDPGAFRGERAALMEAPRRMAGCSAERPRIDFRQAGAGIEPGRARNSLSSLRSPLIICHCNSSRIRNAKRRIPISQSAVDERRSDVLLSRRERRGEYAVRDGENAQKHVLFVVRHLLILFAPSSESDRAGLRTPDLDIRLALSLASGE